MGSVMGEGDSRRRPRPRRGLSALKGPSVVAGVAQPLSLPCPLSSSRG